MAGQDHPKPEPARLYPPPPADFDPFAATEDDLRRHGLPQRPDAWTRPGLAALWDECARRYRGFDHLTPQLDSSGSARSARAAGLGPSPIESCGYSLTSLSAPFTALFIHWTVPNLVFSPEPLNINYFHTFVGLGFLDVHVEMSVDVAQHVTSVVTATDVGQVNLPVGPGDAMSAALCLDTSPPGTANYVLANETRAQTVNFNVDTGFPPAVTVDAGITRGLVDNNISLSPLAHFGVVYFDEISAYATDGPRSLTGGEPITMTETNGTTLARPVRLNDYAFKTVPG